jgi:hypothetical protein
VSEIVAALTSSVERLNDGAARRLIPAELWIGKEDGKWPVEVFTNEAHVVSYLSGASRGGAARRVWRAQVHLTAAVRLVEPKPYLTESVLGDDDEPSG